MARRESAARRYAEAAFEVATRDDALEAWRTELDTAAGVVADERIGRMLANPAVPLEQRTEMAKSILGKSVSQPLNSDDWTTPARASPKPPPSPPRR